MRDVSMLVHHDWREHRLDMPPGPKNVGGGPRVKYARYRSFPNVELILSPDEASHDIVMADWLYFHEYLDVFDEKVKAFLELDVKVKGIIGTELKFLTWADNIRRRLIDGVDFITHVNAYHKQMYAYAGIERSTFVGDPVPEFIFYPAVKERRLVCMGQIAWHKRSELVIELFERLKASDIETCYIGSASMWGHDKDPESEALESQLKAVSDVFVENATQDQVAYWVNRSMFYAHLAWHDCAPISQRECMMAGLVSFALTHPGLREVTQRQHRFSDVKAMTEGIKAYNRSIFPVESKRNREHAVYLNSYASVKRQWDTLLEGVA